MQLRKSFELPGWGEAEWEILLQLLKLHSASPRAIYVPAAVQFKSLSSL